MINLPPEHLELMGAAIKDIGVPPEQMDIFESELLERKNNATPK